MPTTPSMSLNAEREAATYFDDIREAYGLVPDFKRVYDYYNTTFTNLLLHNTDIDGVMFSGPFARTNYLLKEHNASKDVAALVNNLRVRLRKRSELDVVQLRMKHLYDLKALSLFISIIYDVDVPHELRLLFPDGVETEYTGRLVGEVMRIIVTSWTDDYITGTPDDASPNDIKVCYSIGNERYNFDWTYLREQLHNPGKKALVMISTNDQVNILFLTNVENMST